MTIIGHMLIWLSDKNCFRRRTEIMRSGLHSVSIFQQRYSSFCGEFCILVTYYIKSIITLPVIQHCMYEFDIIAQHYCVDVFVNANLISISILMCLLRIYYHIMHEAQQT